MVANHPTLFLFGLCLFGGGLSSGLSLDDPRLRFPLHAAAYLLAAAGGLLSVGARPSSLGVRLAVAVGVVARVAALLSAPAFSDDVFRYVYEGRVTLWAGPLFPFAHPPRDGPALGVPPDLLDAAWLRINHPELSTIYPPLAQAVFAAAAALGALGGERYLLALKGVLVAGDLATWRLLHRHDPRRALLWGLSPLVVWEIAREGHVDGLSALGLAAGVIAFARAHPRIGFIALSSAALTKLNGLVLMPLAVWLERRGAYLLLPALLLLALPYAATLLFGEPATSGLFAYTTRWRSGDGAFSVLLAVAERALGGDWARLEALGLTFTITRHQVARALAGGAFAVFYALVLTSKAGATGSAAGPGRDLAGKGGLVLLVLLLLSPTLHPWYVVWLLPFAALRPFPGHWAALWLSGAAVLLHHPAWLELYDGEWRDLAAVRGLVHGVAWTLLAAEAYARRRRETVTAAGP